MLECGFDQYFTCMVQYAIGLIGGIATGKSLVSQFFKTLGIEVIDADAIARALVRPGESMLSEITAHFGPTILDQKGELNRVAIRKLIFEDSAERKWLEALMHPVIRETINIAIEKTESPYCIVAIPLLKRREDYPALQKVILVDAPLELELARLMERDHISMELAKTIIASQPSHKERLALADFVILNDADSQSLWEKIQKLDLEIREDCL